MFHPSMMSQSSILRLPYMHQIYTHLCVVGMWPGHQFGMIRRSPIPLYAIFFIAEVLVFVVKLMYIINNGSSLSILDLGHFYLGLCVYLLNMIYNQVNTISTILTYTITMQMHAGQWFYNAASFYNNYKLGVLTSGRQALQYSEIPIDTYNIHQYVIMIILNLVYTYICYIGFWIFILLICVIQLHVYGHLEILKNSLESIPKPSGNRRGYDQQEEALITHMLKEIIDYHRMIMRFVSKSSAAFGFTVCTYYAFHLYCGCILLFECSTMDIERVRKLVWITLALIQQLVLISVVYELVCSKSEELKHTVYSIPWEYMNVSNCRTVLFFLAAVQKPVALKSLGMVPVGVRTMASILKTCLSYVLMLRTVATSE